MVYLQSMHMIYTVIGGSGVMGDGTKVPCILATFRNGKKWIIFNNILGMSWSVCKVMDLVKMLRNPKKYTSIVL